MVVTNLNRVWYGILTSIRSGCFNGVFECYNKIIDLFPTGHGILLCPKFYCATCSLYIKNGHGYIHNTLVSSCFYAFSDFNDVIKDFQKPHPYSISWQ